MADQAQILPGTLDLLILKAVSLGPLHGYGILLRIGQISAQALLIEQGALYPALFRLVRQGLLKANWGTSENNRRASVCARKPKAGTVWPRPSVRPLQLSQRKYEVPSLSPFACRQAFSSL